MWIKILFLFVNTCLNYQDFFNQNKESANLLKYELVHESKVSNLEKDPSRIFVLSVDKVEAETPALLICQRLNKTNSKNPVLLKKNGQIVSPKNEFFLFTSSAGYGEVFDMTLVKLNSNYTLPEKVEILAECKFVPWPLILEDKAGHRIEILAIDIGGKSFFFKGTGYKPNESIEFISQSKGYQKKYEKLKADINGSFTGTYLPQMGDCESGPFELIFKDGNSSFLRLQHFWGKYAFAWPNFHKKLKQQFFKN